MASGVEQCQLILLLSLRCINDILCDEIALSFSEDGFHEIFNSPLCNHSSQYSARQFFHKSKLPSNPASPFLCKTKSTEFDIVLALFRKPQSSVLQTQQNKILGKTITMCRFEYDQIKPCGCELYPREGVIKMCVSGYWWPTVVIRRTDGLPDLDFHYQGKLYITVDKKRKNQFSWLPCKEHTYTRRNKVEQSVVGCPWHDDMINKWQLIKSRGLDRDQKRKEEPHKARPGEEMYRAVKAAVTRGGGRASDARR